MAERRIEIIYEALVRGMERVNEFVRQQEHVRDSILNQDVAVRRVTATHEKNTSVLAKASTAIRSVRREMFALSLIAASITAVMIGLSRASNDLGFQMERGGSELQRFSKNLGDLVAKSGVLNPIIDGFKKIADLMEFINNRTGGGSGARGSGETKARGILTDTLISRSLQSQGRTREALELQLDLEFLQKIQDELARGGQGVDRLRQAWVNYRRDAVDALRRSELGLKNNIEIFKDFQREIIVAFKSGIGDPIFSFLQGERKTAGDVFRGFQTGVNRAISNAISESIVSALFRVDIFKPFEKFFRARNPTTDAVDRGFKANNEILERIAQCACLTASNIGSAIGASRGGQVTIDLPGGGGGTLAKIGAIAGLVGAVGGVFSGGGGGGGAPGSIEIPPGVNTPTGRYGGWVDRLPRYQSGGEVPAILHSGEFVMNAKAARENKGALEAMNSGRRAGGNTFYVSINANDAKSFDDMLSSPSARSRLEMQMIRLVMENSNFRRVVRDFAK